jgi:photosystem II stability/assembly factor-like uncharacterized protein
LSGGSSLRVAIVTVAVLAGGCGTAARPSVPAEPRAPSQPRVVRAARITNGPFRSIKPGTAVRLQASEPRAFADATHGFALFDSRSGETFPVATTNRGRVWRIAGPVLHAPAAQGPLAVSQVGVAGPRTYIAYGDGSVVDVTTDGGRHWWRAGLGDEVPAVIASGRQLTAFAQLQIPSGSETLRAVTWVYSSTDGGRTWRADDLLAPP